MPKRDSREPELHDVIRAMGHQVARVGARGVAITRARGGRWTMVLAPESVEAAANEPQVPPALNFSSTDAARLVEEARARRGQGAAEPDNQPTIEAILRASGEAIERAGQDAFLLVADQSGAVGANTEGKGPPIRVTREEVAQAQRARALSRQSDHTTFQPGQHVWYLPRGAVRATPVVVRRIGTHHVTVRFPSGDVAPVHRRWLFAEDPAASPAPGDRAPADPQASAVPGATAAAKAADTPSIHVEALATSLAYSLDLGVNGDVHARLHDLVAWLCEADPSDDAGISIPAGVRQSLATLLSTAPSAGRVQRALLLLRPELHHLAAAGFPAAAQPAIESIAAMDHRLDMLLTGIVNAEPASEPTKAAAAPDVEEIELDDPLTQALDEELAALREVTAHIEAARNARKWLLTRQRMRAATRLPRPEPGAEAPGSGAQAV